MPAQNPQEEEALKGFRRELFDEDILHEGDTIGTDDETLLRFLRARKLNIKLAKKMVKECQEWRKTVGMDELYKQIDPFDYPERRAVFDCWPMWFHKTDRKGRPLNIQTLGGLDLNKLYQECTPEKHWQTVLVNTESLTREILPAASRKAGQLIGTVFVIVDLQGFGLSQFWQMKDLVQKSFQISQDYYPEIMGQLAVVNAPASFTIIWSIVKPWLSKETTEKIDILGSDYKDVLLRLVDEDCLPSVLGGTCTCEDTGGCRFSYAGPWKEGRVGWGPNAKQVGEASDSRGTGEWDSFNETLERNEKSILMPTGPELEAGNGDMNGGGNTASDVLDNPSSSDKVSNAELVNGTPHVAAQGDSFFDKEGLPDVILQRVMDDSKGVIPEHSAADINGAMSSTASQLRNGEPDKRVES